MVDIKINDIDSDKELETIKSISSDHRDFRVVNELKELGIAADLENTNDSESK